MKAIAIFLCFLIVPITFGQIELDKNAIITEKKKEFVNGTIVEKKFVNKAGKELDFGELYLRTGQQDYFIKLSDSSISKEDLRAIIGIKKKFQVSFKEGLWDTDDPNIQSRTGEYVIILAVLQ